MATQPLAIADSQPLLPPSPSQQQSGPLRVASSVPLDVYYAQKAGTDPATLKNYAKSYGGDLAKAADAYAKASQGGQEPGVGDYLKQVWGNVKAAGEGVAAIPQGIYQQAKDIISPPSAPEAKYNAQHALDNLDPDKALGWVKKIHDQGGMSEEDQHDLIRTITSLGAQALLAKAGGSAVENPEAISDAAAKVKSAAGTAADVTGTAIKGAAQSVKEAHTGVAKLAVPAIAATASTIPGIGHALGPAIEGLYDTYHAVKGATGALAERAAQKVLDAKLAETQAAIDAHRAANPPQAYDPNYTSASPVSGPIDITDDERLAIKQALADKIAARQAPPPEPTAPRVSQAEKAGVTLAPEPAKAQPPINLTDEERAALKQALSEKIAARQAPGPVVAAPPKNTPAETKTFFDKTATGEFKGEAPTETKPASTETTPQPGQAKPSEPASQPQAAPQIKATEGVDMDHAPTKLELFGKGEPGAKLDDNPRFSAKDGSVKNVVYRDGDGNPKGYLTYKTNPDGKVLNVEVHVDPSAKGVGLRALANAAKANGAEFGPDVLIKSDLTEDGAKLVNGLLKRQAAKPPTPAETVAAKGGPTTTETPQSTTEKPQTPAQAVEALKANSGPTLRTGDTGRRVDVEYGGSSNKTEVENANRALGTTPKAAAFLEKAGFKPEDFKPDENGMYHASLAANEKAMRVLRENANQISSAELTPLKTNKSPEAVYMTPKSGKYKGQPGYYKDNAKHWADDFGTPGKDESAEGIIAQMKANAKNGTAAKPQTPAEAVAEKKANSGDLTDALKASIQDVERSKE